MTTIHFVRHGNVHNPEGILYGRLPGFRLSEAGIAQAEAAAAALKGRPLVAIYSSPQLRAQQTAALIARHHPGLKVRRTSLLDEVHSPHQGRPIAEMEATGWRLYENLPPGYETPQDVLARVRRFIQRVRRAHPEGEVVAVSHGDVVLALRFWVAGVPFTDDTKNTAPLYPATASITTLTFADGAAIPAMAYHRPY